MLLELLCMTIMATLACAYFFGVIAVLLMGLMVAIIEARAWLAADRVGFPRWTVVALVTLPMAVLWPLALPAAYFTPGTQKAFAELVRTLDQRIHG